MSSRKRLEKAVRRTVKTTGPQVVDSSSLVEYIKLLYEMKREIEMAKRLEEEGDVS